MNTYYNEFDRNAAQWLRNLGEAGEIAPGAVDERSIKEVRGSDLTGIRRAHFFAGIGGWDLALKLAGWPEDEEVWTGSCPCQPFSTAGKQKGEDDPRHLWPDFFRLIAECRPRTIFGEQVGGKAGELWLTGVYADLESIGYEVPKTQDDDFLAFDIPAASVGAPHIRQRLYWVADRGRFGGAGRGNAGNLGSAASNPQEEARKRERLRGAVDDGSATDRLAESGGKQIDAADTPRFYPQSGKDCGTGGVEHDPSILGRVSDEQGPQVSEIGGAGPIIGMVNDELARRSETRRGPSFNAGRQSEPGRLSSPWSDYQIIPCTDGKARRTGARVFPLAHGLPRGVGDGGAWRKGLARGASRARVGMLKGSGNAIVPELAAEFVMAYMEAKLSI